MGTKYSLKVSLVKKYKRCEKSNENSYITKVFTKQSFYRYYHGKCQPFVQAHYH